MQLFAHFLLDVFRTVRKSPFSPNQDSCWLLPDAKMPNLAEIQSEEVIHSILERERAQSEVG